ncbi:aspartate kinase [Salinispira pacifica]|uniref:aspartate kinase n=1 Tax=Salinispira pacifica TaxID=1307761 RepID=V5WIZ4_9SPIO|nr:aspartate kinase [Salinispira pacifica]AHC15504.1 Aspartokinaseassociated with ectoine biosynthesis [Salinispira pacifica]
MKEIQIQSLQDTPSSESDQASGNRGVHTVEKIGGTSMSNYAAVRDNIVKKPASGDSLYQRILVVSAYGGITDKLLEHKKNGKPGIFSLFANSTGEDSWHQAFRELKILLYRINKNFFGEGELLEEANRFIDARLASASGCLTDLDRLCRHGHFSLDEHLSTVREMLASIGEAHSAWNMAALLRRDGVNARFVDLTGWQTSSHIPLDERIIQAFSPVDLETELPIATGYAHSENGLMATFDRGYSEMTFSRIAVLTGAREAVIHKEFHLSSADPKLVGEENAVPIGRTNYDVADHLANLGMEAIHPKAAKGLRKKNIPLRVKNTFEPEHTGTLITTDYSSDSPMVEIIAGRRGVYALEVFDQEMAGNVGRYEQEILNLIKKMRIYTVAKDINANTVTHYLAASLKVVKRIRSVIEEMFPEAEVDQKKVSIVSVIGTDMSEAGMLSQSVRSLAESNINVLSVHQSMRQVEMRFVIAEDDFDQAVKSLHSRLVEVHDHGRAITLAQ